MKLKILLSFIFSKIVGSPTWIRHWSSSYSFTLIMVGKIGWQSRFSRLQISCANKVVMISSKWPFAKILCFPLRMACFASSAYCMTLNSPPLEFLDLASSSLASSSGFSSFFSSSFFCSTSIPAI